MASQGMRAHLRLEQNDKLELPIDELVDAAAWESAEVVSSFWLIVEVASFVPTGLLHRRWVTTSVARARELESSVPEAEKAWCKTFVITHSIKPDIPTTQMRELREAFFHEEYDWLVLRLEDGAVVLTEEAAQDSVLSTSPLRLVYPTSPTLTASQQGEQPGAKP